MVECKVCNKRYKRINSFHLKTHGIKNENEYLNLYPGAKLFDEQYIKNISIGTKIAMDNEEVKNKIRNWERTDEYKEKRRKILKHCHKEGKFDHVYKDKNRNKKISIGRKKWWSNIDKDKRSKMIKEWMKDYIGSDKHKKAQLKAAREGLKANMKNNKSLPEKEFEKYLRKNNINYISQYLLDGKYFDFYLIDKNELIELDGEFYHKDTLEECEYDIQKNNYYNDIQKMKLLRTIIYL